MTNGRTLNPKAVYIEITPRVFEDEESWTGEVEVNIIMDKDNPLDKRSRHDLMHLGQLVASSLPLMEKEQGLLGKLEMCLEEQNKRFTYPENKDNVIHVDFKKERYNGNV